MHFVKHNRPSVVSANPGANFAEIGRLLGKRWGDLSDKDKAPYQQMAETDKQRYEEAMSDYKKEGGGTSSGSSKKQKKEESESEDDDDDDDEDDEDD